MGTATIKIIWNIDMWFPFIFVFQFVTFSDCLIPFVPCYQCIMRYGAMAFVFLLEGVAAAIGVMHAEGMTAFIMD